jgi:hypothetical protein
VDPPGEEDSLRIDEPALLTNEVRQGDPRLPILGQLGSGLPE